MSPALLVYGTPHEMDGALGIPPSWNWSPRLDDMNRPSRSGKKRSLTTSCVEKMVIDTSIQRKTLCECELPYSRSLSRLANIVGHDRQDEQLAGRLPTDEPGADCDYDWGHRVGPLPPQASVAAIVALPDELFHAGRCTRASRLGLGDHAMHRHCAIRLVCLYVPALRAGITAGDMRHCY